MAVVMLIVSALLPAASRSYSVSGVGVAAFWSVGGNGEMASLSPVALQNSLDGRIDSSRGLFVYCILCANQNAFAAFALGRRISVMSSTPIGGTLPSRG